MKHVCDIDNDKVQLEVYQCDCGMHIGVDFTYVDHIDELEITCPNCGKIDHTGTEV